MTGADVGSVGWADGVSIDGGSSLADDVDVMGGDDEEAASRDEMQRIMDLPLNFFPPVETLDLGCEPAVVMAHVLQARAELNLQRSRSIVDRGMDMGGGMIVNRGLVYHQNLPPERPDGEEGGEGEEAKAPGGSSDDASGKGLDGRRFSNASSVTERALSVTGGDGVPPQGGGKWVHMDAAFLEAKRLFEMSVSVLKDSRMKRDIFHTVERRAREVEDVPAYIDEETGEEIPALMKTEYDETPVEVLPFDINLVNSTQASYQDRMRISADGVGALRKIASNSVNALKTQYGVQLNAQRGIKSHQALKVDTNKTYVPTNHDIHTLRAEVLPLVSTAGRDEVALWIEWAISSAQGLGLGLMCDSFNLPISKADAAKEKAAAAAASERAAAADSASLMSGSVAASTDEASLDTIAQGSVFKNLPTGSTIGNKDAYPAVKPGTRLPETFLKEVRGRLQEVEVLLSTKYDGNESKYRPGTKELRLIVNALIARVCMQIRNKRDGEIAVELMEELAGSMNQRTQNADPLYVALASRFRLELEESKVPLGQSDESNTKSYIELLGYAKKYVAAVDTVPKGKDGSVLKRDALKKCINYYSLLSAAPLRDKEVSIKETGTLDMLMCYSDAEIEEKEEEGDMQFLRTFGKVRAMQLMKRMKKLSKK
jgi:hypothetical protein